MEQAPVGDLPLTVLLPVYNGEQYLADTIDSVRTQSYSDFEFLIIDDGSTDRTAEMIAGYAAVDSRIRLLRHSNQGVAYTLNRGIHEARGGLIALIGADDLALPGRFEKQIAFFQENPKHVLLGGALEIINEAGNTTGFRTYPTSDEELRRALLLYDPFGAPSIMFRRADGLLAGGFDTRFKTCEDYDFIFRLAFHGSIANLAEPLAAYRLHQNATKATHTLQQLADTLTAKRTAVMEYGYTNTLASSLVYVAQEAFLFVPPRLTYWLFTKLAIRSA